MNNIVSGNELIINTYEGYDIDEAIDERGDCYKLYLFKRTKAFLEEVNNKKQIKRLFEDIINQYESKLNQEEGVI
jgi:predicted helicase